MYRRQGKLLRPRYGRRLKREKSWRRRRKGNSWSI